jgi:hypothetical protein
MVDIAKQRYQSSGEYDPSEFIFVHNEVILRMVQHAELALHAGFAHPYLLFSNQPLRPIENSPKHISTLILPTPLYAQILHAGPIQAQWSSKCLNYNEVAGSLVSKTGTPPRIDADGSADDSQILLKHCQD